MAFDVKFSKNTAADLTDAVKAVTGRLGLAETSGYRGRLELIDNYIARESHKTTEVRQARMRNRQYGNKTKLGDMEAPIIYTKLASAHSFLVNLFLRGHPIFSAVAPRPFAEIGRMYNALISRDQAKFGWARHLSLALRDGLKYNIMATDTFWHQQFRTQHTDKGVPTQTIDYEGNKILRINPYNLIFDPTVDLNELHLAGAYCGWVERTNYVHAKYTVHALSDDFKQMNKLAEAFNKTPENLHYIPKILDEVPNPENWDEFFGFRPANSAANSSGKYEFLHLYMRIIPKEYEIIAPQAGSPGTWKFIFLNGILIFAQPLLQWEFPLVCSQLIDEGQGMQAKSFCEQLMDIQDAGSFLQAARFASLRRAISDRALYDPTRIRAADINSANPEAKIPVQLNQYHPDLNSAYQPIPYRDDMAGSYSQEFVQMLSFADEVSGITKPFQGSFVKGNRTLHEFQEIMGNAESRLEVLGLAIATQNIHAIKERLKQNYLTFAINEQIFDQKSRQEVTVDAEQMNKVKDAIQLSDGSLPSSKIISADMIQVALQAMPAMPELAQKYDVSELFIHMLKNQGLEDLDDFRRETQAPAGQPVSPTGQ